jgi:hypothetical protein
VGSQVIVPAHVACATQTRQFGVQGRIAHRIAATQGDKAKSLVQLCLTWLRIGQICLTMLRQLLIMTIMLTLLLLLLLLFSNSFGCGVLQSLGIDVARDMHLVLRLRTSHGIGRIAGSLQNVETIAGIRVGGRR